MTCENVAKYCGAVRPRVDGEQHGAGGDLAALAVADRRDGSRHPRPDVDAVDRFDLAAELLGRSDLA